MLGLRAAQTQFGTMRYGRPGTLAASPLKPRADQPAQLASWHALQPASRPSVAAYGEQRLEGRNRHLHSSDHAFFPPCPHLLLDCRGLFCGETERCHIALPCLCAGAPAATDAEAAANEKRREEAGNVGSSDEWCVLPRLRHYFQFAFSVTGSPSSLIAAALQQHGGANATFAVCRRWTLNWDKIEDNIIVGSCPRSPSDVVRPRVRTAVPMFPNNWSSLHA